MLEPGTVESAELRARGRGARARATASRAQGAGCDDRGRSCACRRRRSPGSPRPSSTPFPAMQPLRGRRARRRHVRARAALAGDGRPHRRRRGRPARAGRARGRARARRDARARGRPASSCASRLLEQARAAAVGVDLAAGLAGRAVDDLVLREVDALQRLAAARARLAGVAVHVVDAGRLLVERHARRRTARNSLDALGQLGADRDVQPLDLLVVEPLGSRERREPRGVQDLVRVGAADAGDRALVAQQACAAGRRASARPRAPRCRSASSSGSGPRPASSASSASCVYRPTRTWRRVARSETTSSEPSSNGDAQHGVPGRFAPGLDEREAAVRHQVDHERACRRRPRRACASRAAARAVKRWPTSPAKGGSWVLPTAKCTNTGALIGRACDQRIERLRERLQLGQLRHLREVSRELPHGVRATCNEGSAEGAKICQIFGAAEHLSAHSRAIFGLFVATYVPTRFFP